MFTALEPLLIQAKGRRRPSRTAGRKQELTGATAFPNLKAAPGRGSECQSLCRPTSNEPVKFETLVAASACRALRTLRHRSDDILKAKGARPRVFLANLGTAADFTARATFAKSFFETGGIETIASEGLTDPAALSVAFKASGAALACICSSDKVYAERAGDAAKALQAAGAKHIYLAGRAGEQEQALRAAGVNEFIFAGGDALAVLQKAYQFAETA